MRLKIGTRLSVEVTDIKHAVEVYERERDQSYEGASTFEDGEVYGESSKMLVAKISYNGRVWPV